MNPDIKNLLKDKKVWAAAGVVTVVGVFVLLRKSASTPQTGSGANPAGVASGPGGSYVQGAGDTTGTDIASFLSSYSQSLQAQLNEWGQTLKAGTTTTPPAGDTASTIYPYRQPNDGGPYGYTGVLTKGASLDGLAKLYWGDSGPAGSGAELLRLSNLAAITKNNGNLEGLNLIVPVNPYYK